MKKTLLIWLPVFAMILSILACSMPGAISVQDKIRTQIVQTAASEASKTPFVFEPTAISTPVALIEPTRTITASPTVTSTLIIVPTRTERPTISKTSEPCDTATFIMDITAPDGTVFTPGQSFVKTWRLKNVGTCTWTSEYEAFFDSGDHMSGPNDINLTQSVVPGATIDISVNLVAPGSKGTYRGNWKLRNAEDEVFGLTDGGPFYVEIKVAP